MFKTFLHFAIFAYPHKLGLCILNRPCTVNASLGCPHLECVHVHARHVFCKETVKTLKQTKKNLSFPSVQQFYFCHLCKVHCIQGEGLLLLLVLKLYAPGRIMYSNT